MHPFSATHPSHIFHFCPTCGNKGFDFDGIKAFNCDSCGFRFFINASAAVAVIVKLPDNRIILTRRKFEPRMGTFDLPGGFVDTMERAEDTIKREILEELNIKVQTIEFLSSFPNEYVYRGISYFTCDLAFICTVDDITNMAAADDVAEAILIHPKDIDFGSISFPSIVNILKTYLEKIKPD
jgi:NAD+ diphosphatase